VPHVTKLSVVEWTPAYLSLLHLVFVSSFFVLQFFSGAIDENSPVYIRPIIYVSLYTGANGYESTKGSKSITRSCWCGPRRVYIGNL